MTPEEAKRWILENYFDGDKNVNAVVFEGCDDEIKAMYLAVKALEKQTPKETIDDGWGSYLRLCPTCGEKVFPDATICSCGQQLK